jgi:ubiquitin fusion degradation protein 1
MSTDSFACRFFLVLAFAAPSPSVATDAAVPAAGTEPPRRSRPAWQSKLATYSIASVARREGRRDWNEVTQGNKIVLPRDVYDYLTTRGLPIDKFQLLNPERREALRLFTGPLDFCAPSGECYLPSWVMRQLGIKEGEMCAVATANFPAAAFIKFQPHSSDFLDIGDHTAVLTRTIENLGGLTQGSYVRVSDGQRTYTLDVLEVRGKPIPSSQRDDSNGKAVSIGLLECPIEFAEPKDVVKKASKPNPSPAADVNAAEADSGTSEAGSEAAGKSSRKASTAPSAALGAGTAGARRASTVTSSRSSSSSAGSGSGSGSGSAGAGSSGSLGDAPTSAPVPKFKRRKAAAEGEGEALQDSPFSGRARSLGSTGDGQSEGKASSEEASSAASVLARRRAAVKRAPAAADAAAAAAAAEPEDTTGGAATASPPGLVLVLAKALQMLRSVLLAILSAVRKLLTPDAVSFN